MDSFNLHKATQWPTVTTQLEMPFSPWNPLIFSWNNLHKINPFPLYMQNISMLFTGKSVEQPPCSGRSLLQAAPCALHICSQIDMFLQSLLNPIEPLETQKGTQLDPENILHLPKDPKKLQTHG